MKELHSLRISRSRGGLGGPLPSFAGLIKIEELELAYNQFAGTIPSKFLSGRPSDRRFKVRLTGNQLTGQVPTQLAAFSHVVLELEDNYITSIPESLCQKSDWMDGEVGLVMPRHCDAILCPSGYWSPHGRASTKGGFECKPCKGNHYYGETVCETGGLGKNFEVTILDKLFTDTSGRYWNVTHTNWTKPGVPICYREGVVCGYKPADMNSGVTELRLNNYGLRGHIPTEVFQLPKIRRLAFSFNPVDMSFDGIQRARTLEIIALAQTDVSSLAGIEEAQSMLYDVNVAESHLRGMFPTEIFRVSNLRGLSMNGNRLLGAIPTEIGKLTRLTRLDLSSNALYGALPTELGSLVELQQLDLSGNRLSGTLPGELEGLLKLERLNLAGQNTGSALTGPLPDFQAQPYLHYLNVSWNELSGNVPSTLLNSVDKTIRTELDFSYNKFSGAFPDQFVTFEKLNIDLSGNMIDNLPESVCTNPDWMNGITGIVSAGKKCDTILCPKGSFTVHGRQTHRDEPCISCSLKNEAPYFGSTACLDEVTKREREGMRCINAMYKYVLLILLIVVSSMLRSPYNVRRRDKR
jgi:Leucine-rich repeat (LRR) protein